jgi:hypothetical protein
MRFFRTRLVIWLSLICVGVTLLFFALFGLSLYWNWTFRANLPLVRVGDKRERVENLLGPPRKLFAKGTQLWDGLRQENLLLWLLLPQTPETWVYGRPRLIWLGPSEEDVAIEFDDRGAVSQIRHPGQHP